MGMSIDECITILTYPTYYFPSVREEALDMAIDTLHKYQRIEQIVNNNPDYVHYTDMNTYKVNSIKEVIDND